MDITCTLFPSQREWNKAAVEKMVRKYQTWSGDTGSMPVQSRLTITDYKVVIPALASCMCMFSLPLTPCTQFLSFQYVYNISQNTWGTTERYMSSTCYNVFCEVDDERYSQSLGVCLPSHTFPSQDKSCLRTLLKLVHQRRKYLRYLARTDAHTFTTLLKDLNLKEPTTVKYKTKKWHY